MKFKPYHKIRQFKDIVRDITANANYKGKDEFDNPIYEESIKPILTFTGTVKLHGTNSMVYYTPEKGIIAGKRSSGLNPDQLTAHMGFNQFVQVTKKDYFTELLSKLHYLFCEDNEQIIIYGEWAGKGIQKGVAISELNKAFYIFDCKVYNEEFDTHTWIDIAHIDFPEESNIYVITDFPTFEITIDFNNPKLSQNKLIELTKAVSDQCPVANQLGVKGIGEGIVWKCEWRGERYIFKVKDDRHQQSKVKTLANVDVEVITSIDAFIEYACTINRIEQGIIETEAKEKKDMPDLLRWVAHDIISEENDVLQKNNLEWKQVASGCNNKVRMHFFAQIDKI